MDPGSGPIHSSSVILHCSVVWSLSGSPACQPHPPTYLDWAPEPFDWATKFQDWVHRWHSWWPSRANHSLSISCCNCFHTSSTKVHKTPQTDTVVSSVLRWWERGKVRIVRTLTCYYMHSNGFQVFVQTFGFDHFLVSCRIGFLYQLVSRFILATKV